MGQHQLEIFIYSCHLHESTFHIPPLCCTFTTYEIHYPLPYNTEVTQSQFRSVFLLIVKVRLGIRLLCTQSNSGQRTLWQRWRAKVEEMKKRKAEFIVQYGGSFFLVHELLGISSYLITFSLLYFHVIDLRTIVGWLGWTEADLEKKGVSLNSPFITFAMTVVLVKGMDAMGLVPLRWTLCFLITPRVARYVGPTVNRAFDRIRGLFKRKK